MLVPDGSGALIYNNTAKQNADSYLQKIYGEDIAFAKSVKAVVTKQVYLPVFGVKNKNGGFIAAVDAGTENANIIAESASNEFMYNRAYCTFDVAGADKISIGEGVSELSSSTETYDKKNQLTDKFTVSYMFVSKSADYSEMADVYRNHIGLKKGNVSNTPSVFLELYGGLNRKESVFGIPGLGKYFVQSIQGLDYTMICGTTVFYGAFLIVANLVVDIAYGLIDPRVKLEG